MHAVESSDLTRQVIFGETLSESPIELFVAVSPIDEGRSKVLSKKKCFSNALGYTLVVLEVL